MNPYAFRGWHLPTAYADGGPCDRSYPTMYPTMYPSSYFPTSSVYPFQPETATVASADPAVVVVKQPSLSGNDWKLHGITSPTHDTDLIKNGDLSAQTANYDSLLYKAVASRPSMDYVDTSFPAIEAGTASCASLEEHLIRSGYGEVSCTCSSKGCLNGAYLTSVAVSSRFNGVLSDSSHVSVVNGSSWPSNRFDLSPSMEFKPNPMALGMGLGMGVATNISPYQSFYQRAENGCEYENV